MLLKRQAALADAWKKVEAKKISDPAAHEKAWSEARLAALKGFEKVFR